MKVFDSKTWCGKNSYSRHGRTCKRHLFCHGLAMAYGDDIQGDMFLKSVI